MAARLRDGSCGRPPTRDPRPPSSPSGVSATTAPPARGAPALPVSRCVIDPAQDCAHSVACQRDGPRHQFRNTMTHGDIWGVACRLPGRAPEDRDLGSLWRVLPKARRAAPAGRGRCQDHSRREPWCRLSLRCLVSHCLPCQPRLRHDRHAVPHLRRVIAEMIACAAASTEITARWRPTRAACPPRACLKQIAAAGPAEPEPPAASAPAPAAGSRLEAHADQHALVQRGARDCAGPRYVLVRVGFALMVPAGSAGAIASVPGGWSGIGSGLFSACRHIGTAMGLAILGSIGASVILWPTGIGSRPRPVSGATRRRPKLTSQAARFTLSPHPWGDFRRSSRGLIHPRL